MNFNSRPSARGDGAGATATYQRDVFQFTPLREGRQAAEAVNEAYVTFQFTPLREGRRAAGADGSHSGNFNSRPSARGDFRNYATQEVNLISIHAPPRGATNLAVGSSADYTFQFTPLREGRRDSNAAGDGQDAISIHAPPRGATITHVFCAAILAISIHAPPRGATSRVFRDEVGAIFQFTPLREGRPCRKRL